MAYEPLGNIEEESKRQADAFKQNLPNLKQNLYQGAANQSRVGLAGQLDQIKSQASGRGLLYGGIKQGMDQQAQAGAAGQLSQQQYNINKQLEDQQQSMQQGILSNALERYRGDVSAAEKYYGQDLGRYNLRQQQQGQLFGGLAQGGLLAAAL